MTRQKPGIFTVAWATFYSIIRRKSVFFSSFILPIIFIWVVWWITTEMPMTFKLYGGKVITESTLDVHIVTGALNAIALTAGLFGFLITFENRKISLRLRVAGFSRLTVSLGAFIALTIVLLLSAIIAGLLSIYFYYPKDVIGFAVSLLLITIIYGAIGHILGTVYPRILEGTLIILLFSFIDLMLLTNPLGRTVYLKEWTYAVPGFWPMQILLRASFVGFSLYDLAWMSLLGLAYFAFLIAIAQSPPLIQSFIALIKSKGPRKRIDFGNLGEVTLASWRNIAREKAAVALIVFFPILIVLVAATTSPEGTYNLAIDGAFAQPAPTFESITVILYSLTAIAFVSSIVSFLLSFQLKSLIPRMQVIGYPRWKLSLSYLLVTFAISVVVAVVVTMISFIWVEPKSEIGFFLSLFLANVTFAILGLIVANLSKSKEIGLYTILTIAFMDIGFLENPVFSKRADEAWLKYMPGNYLVRMALRATYFSGSDWIKDVGFIIGYQLVLILIFFITSNLKSLQLAFFGKRKVGGAS